MKRVLLFLFFADIALASADAQHSLIHESKSVHRSAYTTECSDQIRTKNVAAASPLLLRTNCPDTTKWVEFVAALDAVPEHATRTSQKRKINIVHVGCNKGDDLVAHMAMFSKNATYNVSNVRQRNAENGMIADRACPSLASEEAYINKLTLEKSITARRNVFGYCIEPMPSTYNVITKTFADLGLSSTIKTFRYVVSSRPGVVMFPSESAGVESLGLGYKGDVEEIATTAVTVDQFAEEQGLTSIDVLSVDTEGNDARAVIGAINTLPRVKYLEFEYHKVNHWARSDLQDLVDLLDGLGLKCYWAGNNGEVWALTNCWDDDYYNREWSNVACCNRRVEGLCNFMDAHALR